MDIYTNDTIIRPKLTPAQSSAYSNAQLNAIGKTVTDYINAYLGCILASNQTQDYYLDGSGTEHLILPNPISGYTSLSQIIGSGEVLLDNLTFVSYPLNKPHAEAFGRRNGVFSGGMANFKIKDAKIGMFTLLTLPNEVYEVATNMAVSLINAGGIVNQSPASSNTVKTGETIGSYSVQYSLTAETKKTFDTVISAGGVLEKYKQILIA